MKTLFFSELWLNKNGNIISLEEDGELVFENYIDWDEKLEIGFAHGTYYWKGWIFRNVELIFVPSYETSTSYEPYSLKTQPEKAEDVFDKPWIRWEIYPVEETLVEKVGRLDDEILNSNFRCYLNVEKGGTQE